MSVENLASRVAARSADPSTISPGHTVVAVVIEWQGKIALLKRSRNLGHDKGQWHCITGYVESGASPKQQALEELLEETGLRATNLLDLRAGPALFINDEHGEPWLIHTFTAVTSRRRLEIDWEHDSYRWTAPGKVKRFVNRVSWLDRVLQATGFLPSFA
jgi:8-oxo-dGTP pyrophosphatase MutT (NUDIX family)